MFFYFINPSMPRTMSSWDYSAKIIFKRGSMTPLSMLTAASMVPDHHKVVLCDEKHEKINYDMPCDAVCLTGMHLQRERILEISKKFRERGKLVILGGPSVMATPEEYADHVDIRIIGEAERIWPECIKDLEQGIVKKQYVETDKPSLSETPITKYELIPAKKYLTVSLQTTRGCPYLCEFCDIITLYGRRPRTKPIDKVIKEIEAACKVGATNFTFTDDNFIGDPAYTKSLLKSLKEWQQSTNTKIYYHLQTTINLAKKPEILELMAETGCRSVFIGVESPNPDALKETGKVQNLKNDLIEDIQTIRSYGIMIVAGLIVGFDQDNKDIFKWHLDFTNEANIPTPYNNVLGALPGTPLYKRLEKEGRLVSKDFKLDTFSTNIIPAQMTQEELYRGFKDLNIEMFEPEAYSKRAIGEVEELQTRNRKSTRSVSPAISLVALIWLLVCYICDPYRKKLLKVYKELVCYALIRNFSSLEYIVEYLLRYSHACRCVTDVVDSYNQQFTQGENDSKASEEELATLEKKISAYTLPD